MSGASMSGASASASASGYMGFVGVTTGSSSIMRIFPAWARILGLPTDRLVGHDLPMDATPEQYRELVERIRDDPQHLGALVTTHKMGLYEAAHDLFDELDRFATLCGEVSSISKRDGRLIGHAKDPITAGLAVEEFLTVDHFRDTGADAICLGAGGAGTAFTWYLAERSDRPRHITVTDTSQERLDHLRNVHEGRGTPAGLITYLPAQDAAAIAETLAAAPEGTLLANATGLGKDRPGSPLPEDVVFPRRAVVWDFNYRGTLEFLGQAHAQEDERGLTVVDGWRYFLHGWSQVIAEIFDLELTADRLDQLADAAEAAR
jgi:shikimate dehydrogenase